MSDSQVNFKVEKGMYWDIKEFDGSQQEALGFIIPKLIQNGDLYLEQFLEDDPEHSDSNGVFYQPAFSWNYIGVNLNGKIMVDDRGYEDADPVFTSKQSWDVFSKAVETQSTIDSPTELEEAYAHIETLQEALEDAVKEIFSLKHQLIAKAADTCLGIEKGVCEFKPISEMTLEDWKLAKEEGWVFEMNNGSLVFVDGLMRVYISDEYPVEFAYIDGQAHAGITTLEGHYYKGEPEYPESIKCRIK